MNQHILHTIKIVFLGSSSFSFFALMWLVISLLSDELSKLLAAMVEIGKPVTHNWIWLICDVYHMILELV